MNRKKAAIPKMINWIKIIPLTIFLLLITLALTALKNDGNDNMPSTYIGKKPPPLILNPLGKLPRVTEEDLQPVDGKQITLINFWASWCPPCRAEHPQLDKISLIENVKIIGVNYKDKELSALNFLTKYGNPFIKLGRDPNGRNALEWGVYGVPETFIMDQKGKIIFRHPGPITKDIYEKKIKRFIN